MTIAASVSATTPGSSSYLCSHIVVPGPVRHHLPVCKSAHRLRHLVPVLGMHGVPCARVHEEASILCKHPVETFVPEWFGYRVPFDKMHVTPQREVGTNIVRSRLPRDLLAFEGENHADGSRIDEDVEEIGRRHDWRCRLETVTEPRHRPPTMACSTSVETLHRTATIRSRAGHSILSSEALSRC